MADPQTFKLSRPELQADIYYLTEQEGGRKTPVASGYRGQFYYNGKDFDAMQQFVDKAWCHLGDTVQVLLQTASPEFHTGQLYVGKEFEIREGSKTVGKGTITKILRPDFNYWEPKSFLEKLSPGIKPYDGADMQGYCIDFDHYLSETELFSDIDFEETGDKQCMLLVKCKLVKRDIQPRLIADTVIESWKKKLATSNQLYKVDLQVKSDIHSDKLLLDKFTLTFASWHTIYLTGQIIVTQ
ncbi:hypothetical protein [Flavisolibacter tropicus]|uniref:EF-Tu C-terminal domain-related protein n=1 Tax=Flavisolibacter tropicus TaxID=1492898 RepID=UPI00082C324D|nr:hypothetical protein [Flavisolibacter tropicus]